MKTAIRTLSLAAALTSVMVGCDAVGYGIAERWPQTGPYLDDIARYVNSSLGVLAVVVLFGYFLYRFLLWRLWRLRDYRKVKSLRGPWWVGILITFLLCLVVLPVLGLILLSPLTVEVIVVMFVQSVGLSLVGALLFWILSLISSPLKVMYTPPLRVPLLKLLGKSR